MRRFNSSGAVVLCSVMGRWLLSCSVLALVACASTSPRRLAVPRSAEDKRVPPTTPAPTIPDDVPELPDGDVVAKPGQTEAPPARKPVVHPLAKLSAKELAQMLDDSPAAVGPASLGGTSTGALFNGVQMPKGPQWKLVNRHQSWGTQETVDNLVAIIGRVNVRFPNTQPIHLGDISEKRGGHIPPHVSHQSGRDVDIGFYYKTTNRWFTKAQRTNLDVARTWALVRATVTQTDVEVIFVDRRIQKLMRKHAERIGEDSTWLDTVFGGPTTSLRPLLRHARGHRTHLHIRFYNPIAQETGRRIYRMLVRKKKISRPTYYIRYRVKRGDSLSRLAKRFKTTVRAIKRANRLRSSRIYTRRKYRIPRRGGVRQSTTPVVIPARRLPPAGKRL